MNAISYNVLMLLFEEYRNENILAHTMYNLYSETFNDWIENIYGFRVDLGVTSLGIQITDPNKKLLFDVKFI